MSEEAPEESFAELYESSPAGYITALADGTIVRVNETFARWIGASKDEIERAGRVQDLLTVPSRIYFETHVAPLLRLQGAVSEIALDVRAREGTLPVLISAQWHAASASSRASYRVTVFNATERRRYERELLLARRRAEDAARVKSDLIAMLGHDIAAPLGGILGMAQLLDRTELTPRQRELLDLLKKSSENLVALIDDILDYSKLEAGKLPVEEKPFSVRAMLDGVAASFTTRAAEKGVQFVVHADDDVPDEVTGDPVKIAQVLTNLAANALKFTREGHVSVTAHRLGQDGSRVTLEFAVTDTGIGIEHDQLRNIFEEFTQANADIGLKYGGTGLGLAISRKLLALFDSEMTVTSSLGHGSSFAFSIELKLGVST